MKKSIKITATVFMILISTLLFSQEKPFRIGLKLGFPNIIGGNLEYATPLLGKKLAASIEYSSISADKFMEPDEAKLTYLQIGFNYYFFKEGSGLYSNVSYGMLDADLTLIDIESDFDYDKLGNAFANLSNKSFNVKLGAKLGSGFYFRPEIGYSFTSLDKIVEVNVKFPDGSSEIQQEEIPSELTQGLLFNIGFGFAF